MDECCICQCSLAGPADGGDDVVDAEDVVAIDTNTRNDSNNDRILVASIPCGHVLHLACVERWKQSCRNRTGSNHHHTTIIKCPMCNTPTQDFQRIFLDLSVYQQQQQNGLANHDDSDSDDDSISSMEDYCGGNENFEADEDSSLMQKGDQDENEAVKDDTEDKKTDESSSVSSNTHSRTRSAVPPTAGVVPSPSDRRHQAQEVIELLDDNDDTTGSSRPANKPREATSTVAVDTANANGSGGGGGDGTAETEESKLLLFRKKASKYRRKLKHTKARSKQLHSRYQELTGSYRETMSKLRDHETLKDQITADLEAEQSRRNKLMLTHRQVHLDLVQTRSKLDLREQQLQQQRQEMMDSRKRLGEFNNERDKLLQEHQHRVKKLCDGKHRLEVENSQLRTQLQRADKKLHESASLSTSDNRESLASSSSSSQREKQHSSKQILRELAAKDHLYQKQQLQRRRQQQQQLKQAETKLTKGSAHAKRMIQRGSTSSSATAANRQKTPNAMEVLDLADFYQSSLSHATTTASRNKTISRNNPSNSRNSSSNNNNIATSTATENTPNVPQQQQQQQPPLRSNLSLQVSSRKRKDNARVQLGATNSKNRMSSLSKRSNGAKRLKPADVHAAWLSSRGL